MNANTLTVEFELNYERALREHLRKLIKRENTEEVWRHFGAIMSGDIKAKQIATRRHQILDKMVNDSIGRELALTSEVTR